MDLSQFQLEILGRVADDYEAIDTIRDDIARDLERPVSDEEVWSALLSLAHSGLVDVFFYDASSSRYCPAEVDQFPVADLWVLTSKRGRVEYERLA